MSLAHTYPDLAPASPPPAGGGERSPGAAKSPGEQPLGRFKRTCPECGTEHRAARHDAQFCGAVCRKAFNNRRLVRGAELYDLFMTLRYERAYAVKARVWQLLCRLAKAYREEDEERRGGRKSWGNAGDVVARRPWLLSDVIGRNLRWNRPDVR